MAAKCEPLLAPSYHVAAMIATCLLLYNLLIAVQEPVSLLNILAAVSHRQNY